MLDQSTSTGMITTETVPTTSTNTTMSFGFHMSDRDHVSDRETGDRDDSTGVSLPWDTTEGAAVDNAEGEEEKVKEIEMLASAFAASGREGLAIKKIGPCDGSKADVLLKWLRNLDIVEKPVDIARATATGPLGIFLAKLSIKEWPKLRTAIATQFISAAFPQTQRDALLKLTQRPGESLVTFNYEFEALIKEGYETLPEQQEDLIRAYLSALNDRKLAISVFNKKPTTLVDAMRLASERDRVNDFLRPRVSGRVAEIAQPEVEDKIGKHLDTLTQTVNSLAKMQANLANQVAAVATNPKPPSASQNKNCYRCSKPGHIARDCRAPAKTDNPRSTMKIRCYRCNRLGHSASNCRSPSKPETGRAKCLRCQSEVHRVHDCKAGPPSRPCLCGGHHWAYDCPNRNPQQPGNWRAPNLQ
jgi:cellular nucleic acid-binding protein